MATNIQVTFAKEAALPQDPTEGRLEVVDESATATEVEAYVGTQDKWKKITDKNKAGVTGYYEGMAVGYADEAANAETADEAASLQTSVGVTDETPFAAQPVGGSSDITTTYQKLNKLVACNVVKNQLVDTSFTGTGVSFSEGYLTATNTTGGNVYRALSTSRNFIKDHKYLVFLSKVDKDESIIPGNSYLLVAGTVTDLTSTSIVTPANDYIGAVGFVFGTVSAANSYYKAYIYIVDLTLRYGSTDVVNAVIGSDSSKYVEKLIAFDPNILKDTDYDTGSFSECKTAELLTIDYNQWDEEWENGYIDNNGILQPSSSYIRSKNPIQVLPNKEYFVLTGTYAMYFTEYDAYGNFIKQTYRVNTTITTQPNTAFVKFYMGSSYGTTYNHDICIFFYWDGSRIGYEPYKEHHYPMPNVAGHGILKVVNGKVVADGDVMTPDGSGNQTMYSDEEDLSTKTWSTDSGMHYTQLINMATSGGDRVRCTNYVYYAYIAIGSLSNLPAGGFTVSSNYIYVNSGESNPNGKVIYKLATPTALTAPTFTSTFYGDDFGTMWWLDENGNVIDGLQGNEIFYKANVSGFAESMYIEADGDPEYFAPASSVTEEATDRGAADTILQNAIGGTLRQCLCVKESLDFDNTAVVDLGNQTWTKSGSIFYFILSDKKAGEAPMMCSKYKYVANGGFGVANLSIADSGNASYLQWVIARDDSYADAAAFKAAMKGVLLAYEKAST